MSDDTVGRITFGLKNPWAWIQDGTPMARFPGGEPFEVREPRPASKRSFCPFCHSEDVVAEEMSPADRFRRPGQGYSAYAVECLRCGAQGPHVWDESTISGLSRARRSFVAAPEPAPRPAPTLAQLELVADMAAASCEGDLSAEEWPALEAFRAYLLGDDPEAGQNLAEIVPALMRIGELSLKADKASRNLLAFGVEDDGTAPEEAWAHIEATVECAARKLAEAVDEYRRRFPDPAGLPKPQEE